MEKIKKMIKRIRGFFEHKVFTSNTSYNLRSFISMGIYTAIIAFFLWQGSRVNSKLEDNKEVDVKQAVEFDKRQLWMEATHNSRFTARDMLDLLEANPNLKVPEHILSKLESNSRITPVLPKDQK